ncbi:IclR family transcriptional regulator [Aeromicrobium wangtongii]|uniref:IclR family transcriptional regulator n=1 Tax=Aeromicrobium wangtongii TaxID=2969247 RepID=A0ABY5MBH2_9ACTN|nr:IclR family transcriptional regulator [Aeromicrobium wangtongii]MCD9196945.1 IclR family transcriptional regulator [Aeromicrobium wangtongii]UUP14451.1 IclR family transcriptional regulator [Aeromicrobium wangtongii]
MTQASEHVTAVPRSTGGVQSVQRALDLVEIVAAGGGQMAIGEIAAGSDIPLPTIHRLLKTLIERGYMRQLPNRRYALGYRLVPLGIAAGATVGANAQSVLAGLVDQLGESANLAVLSGDHAEYVAQVPSRHSMRMFTEVGRRVELHCTGVGKALLAQLDSAQVQAIVRRVGMPAYTPHTITDEVALGASLAAVRERGFSIDQEEQELGVRCVAVPIPTGTASWMAISVSGPLGRMTDEVVDRAVPLLRQAAATLAADLTGSLNSNR